MNCNPSSWYKMHDNDGLPDDVLSRRWFVDTKTLRRWGRFRVFEEVEPQLRRLPHRVVPSMISHRWLTRIDPDPNREQYARILSIARPDDYFWYDYSCMPQSGCGRAIQEVLDTLHTQVRASRFIILRSIDDDYYRRGWCYHEWFTAQFVGCVERLMLSCNAWPQSYNRLIVQQTDAKRVADQLISGDPGQRLNVW